ncbi:MAG: TIGR04282 family arsenosugar biosynthesis glycosyltransferase [Planctomycetota bacterium]
MNHLGLFAKYWEPGKVKTRLAKTIGNENACWLYRSFVLHLISRLEGCGDRRSIVYSPPEKRSEFQSVAAAWELTPQSSGDLGTRMCQFLNDQFESQSNRQPDPAPVHKSLIIGADCMMLNAEVIRDAFDTLDNCSVVLGPSRDGGYYLVGMKDRCFESIFAGIEWGTSNVLADTIKILEQNLIEYRLLDESFDIDHIEDVKDLKRELSFKNEIDELDQNLLNQINKLVFDGQDFEGNV